MFLQKKKKRNPIEWFKLWGEIIRKEGEVSRLKLSELSGASIWTIKELRKDFLEYDAYVIFINDKFRLIRQNPLSLLADFTRQDKEELK